jgi:hypothetical protein
MWLWIISSLEQYGISKAIGWFISLFRSTPQKDMEKAHEVENKVVSMSDNVVSAELRNKWTRPSELLPDSIPDLHKPE